VAASISHPATSACEIRSGRQGRCRRDPAGAGVTVEVAEMIARHAGWTPKAGLEVYVKDGQKVGYFDQASDAQGWMQVEALGLDL
jgi:hypothetical protein